jgi:hypothetical protein
MICETDLQVSWRTRPGGFVALMGLYESNYLRLQLLAGELRGLNGARHSHVSGDCELQLAIIEHARYTSELRLTYLLPETDGRATGFERLPDLRLRAYHDARLLEAMPEFPGPEREVRQCWRRNMMLNKWLEYCAERGHRFG